MKKLPRQVEILGRKIKVEICELEEGLWGHYLSDDCKIQISSECPDEGLEATLLHECIHAILDVSGEEEVLTEQQQEKYARLFEHGLGHMIKFIVRGRKG